MDFIYGLLVGAIIGAGVMVFVYKNNVNKLTALAEEAELKYKKLETAIKEKAKKG